MKKNRLATSARKLTLDKTLLEIAEEEAIQVNGGQKVFGVAPIPAPGPTPPGGGTVFGVVINPKHHRKHHHHH
ncbi:MAG TPA: hypothetical protein VFF73_12590 [Planctomycetota bacterium]|nr:hypothetical protein [Planctomycetota bacterium]